MPQAGHGYPGGRPGGRNAVGRRPQPRLIAVVAVALVLLIAGGGYLLIHGLGSGPNQAAASSPPHATGAARSPGTTSKRSPAAPPAGVVAWIGRADRVLHDSASVRMRLARATIEARHGRSGLDRALRQAGIVIRERGALLSRVRSWRVPAAARTSRSLLASSLQASLASDHLYQRWLSALAAKHKAQARSLLAQAGAQDGVTVGIKHEFLRAFNTLRKLAGEPALGKNYFF